MTRSGKRRPERLAALIQESVAAAMAKSLKDPRIGFVTVTGVSVSADGTHAVVRVSVMGNEEDKARALEGLESARGFIRRLVGQRVRMRYTPELIFTFDKSLEYGMRIEETIERIKHELQSPAADDSQA